MLYSILFGLLLFQNQNHLNVDRLGLAIEGYDPVSYFVGNPSTGSSEFVSRFNGATYQFKSLENLKKFELNPEKYVPQYGGWCAYALGLSTDKVKIDPQTYKIIGEKLYLFYNFKGVNTLALWNEEESKLLPQANKNWSQIIGK